MDATPEFLDAVDRHHIMTMTLGADHALTQRALTLVMELAPKKFQIMA